MPIVSEDQVHDHLRNLKIHKPTSPQERVLREPADIVAKPFLMTFEKSWQSDEVRGDWKKSNITPFFRKRRKDDPGNYCPVTFISVTRNIMK